MAAISLTLALPRRAASPALVPSTRLPVRRYATQVAHTVIVPQADGSLPAVDAKVADVVKAAHDASELAHRMFKLGAKVRRPAPVRRAGAVRGLRGPAVPRMGRGRKGEAGASAGEKWGERLGSGRAAWACSRAGAAHGQGARVASGGPADCRSEHSGGTVGCGSG